MTPRSNLLPLGLVLAAFTLFGGYSLQHLYDPPVGTHGWRQSISTTEARLYAAGQPFLYPRGEGCGADPKVFMGSEFPLYAWTMGKLGGAGGINFVGRVMGLLSALVLMLSTFVILRHVFRGWEEPYRSVTATAAASFFAVSPLFRFYGIGFVPDLEAHALALAGIAVLAGPFRAAPRSSLFESGKDDPPPLSLLRLVVAAVLLSLACLTKLIAVPHLALAGVVLLDRARPRPGLSGFASLRPWLMAALLVLVVAVPVYLWYVRWIPVLKAGGCDMVWLPDGLGDTWKTQTFTDPEWRHRMAKWGREDLLGVVWPACLAGLPLFFFAGFRGVLLFLWSIGCGLGYVSLGWHTKQHDYDFLLVLPAFAMGFGASFGMASRLLAALAERVRNLPGWLETAAPYLALVAAVLALSPGAHKQSRRHWYTGMDEVGLEDMLDKVLPEGEPIHFFGGRVDPRVPYYANRLALAMLPPGDGDPHRQDQRYCLNLGVTYDCCLAVGTGGKTRICEGRQPAVIWPGDLLHCGIATPDAPVLPDRIVQTALKTIRTPKDQPVAGLGRVLGTDRVKCGTPRIPCAGMPSKDFLDLYVVPEVGSPPVELLADGVPLALDPPPSKWLAGSLMIPRVELPSPTPQRLELRLRGTDLVALPAP